MAKPNIKPLAYALVEALGQQPTITKQLVRTRSWTTPSLLAPKDFQFLGLNIADWFDVTELSDEELLGVYNEYIYYFILREAEVEASARSWLKHQLRLDTGTVSWVLPDKLSASKLLVPLLCILANRVKKYKLTDTEFTLKLADTEIGIQGIKLLYQFKSDVTIDPIDKLQAHTQRHQVVQVSEPVNRVGSLMQRSINRYITDPDLKAKAHFVLRLICFAGGDSKYLINQFFGKRETTKWNSSMYRQLRSLRYDIVDPERLNPLPFIYGKLVHSGLMLDEDFRTHVEHLEFLDLPETADPSDEVIETWFKNLSAMEKLTNVRRNQ